MLQNFAPRDINNYHSYLHLIPSDIFYLTSLIPPVKEKIYTALRTVA